NRPRRYRAFFTQSMEYIIIRTIRTVQSVPRETLCTYTGNISRTTPRSKAAGEGARSTQAKRRSLASRLFLSDLLRGHARTAGRDGGRARIRGCRPRLRLATLPRESRSLRRWHSECERLRLASQKPARLRLAVR